MHSTIVGTNQKGIISMKIKRITAILLSVCVLAGCGVAETVSDTPASEPKEEAEASEEVSDIEEETEEVEVEEEMEEPAESLLLYDIATDFGEDSILSEPCVGEERELTTSEAKFISGDPTCYIRDWAGFTAAFSATDWDAEPDTLFFLTSSESYKVFGGMGKILVETPKHTYLEAELPYTSVSMGFQPVITQKDYDEDGEPELLMVVSCYTGTEFYVEAAFMVDQDEAGAYHFYHILPEWYLRELCDHVTCEKDENNKLILKVDGEVAQNSFQVSEEPAAVYPGRLNYIESFGSNIRIKCELSVFSESDVMGSYPWQAAELLVHYMGAGKMEMASVSVPRREGKEVYEAFPAWNEDGENYYIWDDSSFPEAVLFKSNDCFDMKNYDYCVVPITCSTYVMDGDGLVSMGDFEIAGSGYPLALSDGTLVCASNHSIEAYAPNFEEHSWYLKEAWYDEITAPEGMSGCVHYDGASYEEIGEEELYSQWYSYWNMKWLDLRWN